MFKLRNYLLKTFAGTFFSIMLPLLAIASIIILVKISQVTAIVQLDLFDMFMLYLFIVPQMLFYSVPIAFFVAAVLTLHKLSNDNEMVVLFALGIKPNRIIWILSKVSLFLSAILLFTSLVVVPHAKQLYSNFINYKKSNITFNIKESKFGQRFGTWLIYIGKKNINDTYSDIALYKGNEEGKEMMIISDKARISNENMQVQFRLTNGKAFLYSTDQVTQINFDRMKINDTSNLRRLRYTSVFEIWDDIFIDRSNQDRFITFILVSLLPFLALPLYLALGVVNSRHQKSPIYLHIFLSLIFYFALFNILSGILYLWTIPVFILLWLGSTYYIYKKKILNRY